MAIWLQAMQAQWPGYSPQAADRGFIQAQIFASWCAAVAQQCNAGATDLFTTFGTDLVNLPYQTGTPALAIIQVTAVDTSGYTLPSGTQVTLTLSGATVGFTTIQALTIPNGQSTGQITVAAIQSGSATNGAGSPASLVSQVDWVLSVSLVTTASSGVDQEDQDHYANRLATTLQALGYPTCTATDFAIRALDFVPAAGTDQEIVGRASAIDGYDPGTNTYNNERECTVAISDASGNPLNSDTLTAVASMLAFQREVNYIVNVVSPNYTPIYACCTVVPQTGYSAATIQANVQSALLAYLNPQNFGLPQQALSGWVNNQSISMSRVISTIQLAQGVSEVVTGSVAVDVHNPPTNTSADLTLARALPLADDVDHHDTHERHHRYVGGEHARQARRNPGEGRAEARRGTQTRVGRQVRHLRLPGDRRALRPLRAHG